MHVRLFLLATWAADCLAEWVHISSASSRKALSDNGTARSFGSPADEFTCARIHNLTMAGYADETPEPAPEAVPDSEDFFGRNMDGFLQRLRRRLDRQIEDRIQDLGSLMARESRSHQHMGFPSLEGALISISLLIFAVYLIKLVMKVVYAFNFKRGTTDVLGLLSNVRQPIIVGPNHRRTRSSALDLDGWKINHFIDEQSLLFN